MNQNQHVTFTFNLLNQSFTLVASVHNGNTIYLSDRDNKHHWLPTGILTNYISSA